VTVTPTKLLIIGTMIGLCSLALSYGSGVFIVPLLFGMLAVLVGSLRLCRQLSKLRLLLAAPALVGVGFGILWVASLTPEGLNPHGFGIIVAFPVLETFLLALTFVTAALLRSMFQAKNGAE
jgi:hypothetical protein